MPRIPTVAITTSVVVRTVIPAVMAIFSSSVWVRLMGTVGRRACQGPISLSA